MEITIVAGFGIFGMILVGCAMMIINGRQQLTIKAQQDTIQKLLNREPVTYKEVNVQPPKPDTDRSIAWGGMIGNRDEI